MSPPALGLRTRRVEDLEILTGAARYTADVLLNDALVAVFVRSTAAFGKIRAIETEEAKAGQGVVGVYIASDLGRLVMSTHRGMPDAVERPLLADGVVRFVGEPVAVVVAENQEQAEDASDRVVLQIDSLAPTLDPISSLLSGIHNVVAGASLGSDEDLFKDADIVLCTDLRQPRIAPLPLEPNAVAAAPSADGSYAVTVWASTQVPFALRDEVARVLGLRKTRVRVIAPAVGGAFGGKGFPSAEQIVIAALAVRLERPIRWVESRSENLVAMTHGRGSIQTVEIGATSSGILAGLRVRIVVDAGAYPTPGAFIIPTLAGKMACGAYGIPRLRFVGASVLTNKTPMAPYRGAGRAEAATSIERAIDMVALQLSLDPSEVRRRNLIPSCAFPYTSPSGAVYDSGDYALALNRALHLSGYDDLRHEQDTRRARRDVLQIGIGLSTYVDMTGSSVFSESAAVEVNRGGTITVYSGASAHGQGHRTAYAQIVSHLLGVPVDCVTVVQSDTAVVDRGQGTFASRSVQVGGSAVYLASTRLLERAKRLAAYILALSPGDVVQFEGGKFVAEGRGDAPLTWADLAAAALKLEDLPAHLRDGLRSGVMDFQQEASHPFGTHVAVAEVDTETGAVRLLQHTAVADCGTLINPLISEGQLHGGIAQGIGQALLEEVAYSNDGCPLTRSLLTYSIPTAPDVPSFRVDHMETPSPYNPLGAKGIGEAGIIGAAVAIQNAVVNALSHLGIRHIDMPLTPERVWRAIVVAQLENSPIGPPHEQPAQ